MLRYSYVMLRYRDDVTWSRDIVVIGCWRCSLLVAKLLTAQIDTFR